MRKQRRTQKVSKTVKSLPYVSISPEAATLDMGTHHLTSNRTGELTYGRNGRELKVTMLRVPENRSSPDHDVQARQCNARLEVLEDEDHFVLIGIKRGFQHGNRSQEGLKNLFSFLQDRDKDGSSRQRGITLGEHHHQPENEHLHESRTARTTD